MISIFINFLLLIHHKIPRCIIIKTIATAYGIIIFSVLMEKFSDQIVFIFRFMLIVVIINYMK